MNSRRKFLKLSSLASLSLGLISSIPKSKQTHSKPKSPILISTWMHGLQANDAGWKVMSEGGSGLDAIEQGARVVESDPKITSVGLGGLPDAEGIVTLDACIMDKDSSCGAVTFLQDIENPISVARKVMEDTPHVILSGTGAKQFAISKGFKTTDLLTDDSKKAWKKWKESGRAKSSVNSENHDTIGLLAMDSEGDIYGGCTTSGMAFKMHGRVGDSPIIGSGLFIDNEVGGCTATGQGEAIIRASGSSSVVELMRLGYKPQQACEQVVNRIIKQNSDLSNLQVAFLAINKSGEVGACSIHPGFNFAYKSEYKTVLSNSKYIKG
jgi:isoaspartyl peptidase/L-asparaginase-like protein (Ntn-hydrolase superfamily)